jgi:hypothetical protein
VKPSQATNAVSVHARLCQMQSLLLRNCVYDSRSIHAMWVDDSVGLMNPTPTWFCHNMPRGAICDGRIDEHLSIQQISGQREDGTCSGSERRPGSVCEDVVGWANQRGRGRNVSHMVVRRGQRQHPRRPCQAISSSSRSGLEHRQQGFLPIDIKPDDTCCAASSLPPSDNIPASQKKSYPTPTHCIDFISHPPGCLVHD